MPRLIFMLFLLLCKSPQFPGPRFRGSQHFRVSETFPAPSGPLEELISLWGYLYQRSDFDFELQVSGLCRNGSFHENVGGRHKSDGDF